MRIHGLFSAGLALLLGSAGAAVAAPAYPKPPTFAPFHLAPAEEIALARSAAPASISGKAEVLTLGPTGYTTAVKGSNGFVCIVERSWDLTADNPEFWNPKVRSPQCLNAVAARSVLPAYLERTRQVLAGTPMATMQATAKAHPPKPAPGAFCFMMSKQGYLADAVGHAHPHVMFYRASGDEAAWGAGLPGSPVGSDGGVDGVTTFFVSVPRWSDGTSAMDMH